MVLSNSELYRLINNENLIEGADLSNIKNCSYTMRIGEVYEPNTGYVLDLDQEVPGRKRVNYIIRPSEVLIVKTKERIHTPLDICASYTALHSLASQGLLLINSSIVEPGYQGNLSCFIVNFSKEDICFGKNANIVKLVFYKLDQKVAPTPFQKSFELEIPEENYRQSLAKKAINFHPTFLDIESVETRASEKAQESIKKGISWSGAFVAFLLLWATLEPMISKWIYKASNYEDVIGRGLLLDKINSLGDKNEKLEDHLRILEKQLEESLRKTEVKTDSSKTR